MTAFLSTILYRHQSANEMPARFFGRGGAMAHAAMMAGKAATSAAQTKPADEGKRVNAT
jgi:hypothetical protein